MWEHVEKKSAVVEENECMYGSMLKTSLTWYKRTNVCMEVC